MAFRPSEPGMFTPANMMTTAPEESGEGFSVIDRQSNFDGAFIAKRDLRIEGEVKGTIECHGTLFIAQGANVNARVEAENITVAGDFAGEVVCRGRLQIMPSGRLKGKVNTRSLVINEGAFYEGEMEMPQSEARVGPGAAPRVLPGGVPQRQPAPQPPTASAPTAPPPSAQPPTGGESGSRTFIRRFGGPETAWEGNAPPRESEGDEGAEES